MTKCLTFVGKTPIFYHFPQLIFFIFMQRLGFYMHLKG